MLVPAGVMVLLVLGAIAVDSSIAFMTQQELENRAAAAANDAVTVAISEQSLQRAEDAAPDAGVAAEYVRRSLAGARIGSAVIDPAAVTVDTDEAAKTVTVRIEADVPYLFAPGVPGARTSVRVAGESSARLEFRR